MDLRLKCDKDFQGSPGERFYGPLAEKVNSRNNLEDRVKLVGDSEQQNIFPKSVSKEAINRLPLGRYKGEINLINNDRALEIAVQSLQREKVLGFDTETRPTFHKGQSYPLALLQLATPNSVYLFQLRDLESLELLSPILSNAQIIKAGVAIHDDIKKLKELCNFQPAGFLELSSISQKLGIVNTGLRSLFAIFLSSRVSKGAQVSNWSRRQLTKSQINYAATDAWVSLRLYQRFEELNLLDNKK